MKIEKLNENQIRCTLTHADLAARHLKLSELAYGTEKAKSLFRDMMQQASFDFGFEAENIPLMIEAIPSSADSIVLIITKVEDPEELDTRFSKFTPGSDAEMLRLYRSRPDAFNEEELLRVTTLVMDEAERKAVYQTVLRFFPRSEVAANNLAVIYLNEGNAEEAEALWRQSADRSEEARYNLGLLLAKQRRLDEAVRLLAPFDDGNARIVKSVME